MGIQQLFDQAHGVNHVLGLAKVEVLWLLDAHSMFCTNAALYIFYVVEYERLD